MNQDHIPECCEDCANFDFEWDERKGRSYYSCMLNVLWPTRKQSCKRKEPLR